MKKDARILNLREHLGIEAIPDRQSRFKFR